MHIRHHHDRWTDRIAGVANAPANTRRAFIHKTYQHLAIALGAFVGIEALLLQLPLEGFISFALQSRFGWLAVLGAFMLVSVVANNWATNAVSLQKQYAGLFLYVVAEAIIFLPLLYVAIYAVGPDVIAKAGLTTAIVFGGLTASVLISKKDFSFMGRILTVAGWGALAIIVVSLLFGFNLGTFFSGAMVVFAAGAIVYNTSNVLHQYQPGQHVAAALSLFASVALLFWYVLQLFMSSRD